MFPPQRPAQDGAGYISGTIATKKRGRSAHRCVATVRRSRSNRNFAKTKSMCGDDSQCDQRPDEKRPIVRYCRQRAEFARMSSPAQRARQQQYGAQVAGGALCVSRPVQPTSDPAQRVTSATSERFCAANQTQNPSPGAGVSGSGQHENKIMRRLRHRHRTGASGEHFWPAQNLRHRQRGGKSQCQRALADDPGSAEIDAFHPLTCGDFRGQCSP